MTRVGEVNELLEGLGWSACFRGEGYEYSRVGWSTCKGRGGKEDSSFVRSQICRRWRWKRKKVDGEWGGGRSGFYTFGKKMV